MSKPTQAQRAALNAMIENGGQIMRTALNSRTATALLAAGWAVEQGAGAELAATRGGYAAVDAEGEYATPEQIAAGRAMIEQAAAHFGIELPADHATLPAAAAHKRSPVNCSHEQPCMTQEECTMRNSEARGYSIMTTPEAVEQPAADPAPAAERTEFDRLLDVTDGDPIGDTVGLVNLVRTHAVNAAHADTPEDTAKQADLVDQHRAEVERRVRVMVDEIGRLNVEVAELRAERATLASALEMIESDAAMTRATFDEVRQLAHRGTENAEQLDPNDVLDIVGRPTPAEIVAWIEGDVDDDHDPIGDATLDRIVERTVAADSDSRAVLSVAIDGQHAVTDGQAEDLDRHPCEDICHPEYGACCGGDPEGAARRAAAPLVEPVKLWITFGSVQRHPVTGELLGGAYAVVEGADDDEARRNAFLAFGKRFAFDYPSAERAGVEQFGLREVPAPRPCDRCVDVGYCVLPTQHHANEVTAYGLALFDQAVADRTASNVVESRDRLAVLLDFLADSSARDGG